VTRKEGVPDELVACVVLNTPLETCQERVREREGHFLTEKNVKVVSTWHKSLEANYPNRKKEGFGAVFTLKSDKKRDAFLEMMAVE